MHRTTRHAMLAALFVLSLWGKDYNLNQDEVEFSHYAAVQVPFKIGEKLEMEFGWSNICAATGSCQVKQTVVDGKNYYHFVVSSRTTDAIELLYKNRRQLSSTADMSSLLPRKYLGLERTSKDVRQTALDFDRNTNIAIGKVGDGKRIKEVYTIRFQAGLDPVSFVYFVRSLDWKVGDKRVLEVIGPTAIYAITIEALKEERIKVSAGEFDSMKLKLKMKKLTGRHREDDNKKFRDTYIWASTDEHHLPLRMETACFVGTIFCELKSFQDGQE